MSREIWGSPLKVRDLRQVFILHTFRNTNGFGPWEQIEEVDIGGETSEKNSII